MLQIILGPHQPNETPSSLRPDNGALFDAKAWRSCHRITLPFAKVKQARISAPYTRAHTSTHAHAYTNTNTRTNMQARTLFRTYARMCTCTRHRLLLLTLLRRRVHAARSATTHNAPTAARGAGADSREAVDSADDQRHHPRRAVRRPRTVPERAEGPERHRPARCRPRVLRVLDARLQGLAQAGAALPSPRPPQCARAK